MKKMNPMLQMALCAILWSLGGILFKWIPWNPFVIAGFRSLLAGITAVIYMIIAKIPIKLNSKTWIGAGFMMFAFFGVVASNKLTTAANAVVLQYTQPVFIMLISIGIFKKKAHIVDFTAVGGVLLGIILFFLDQLEEGYILGNIVALMAGACLAGMFLAMETADKNEKITATILGHFLTAIIGIPFIFFYDTPVSLHAVGAIMAAGIFQMGIAYLLFVFAVDRVSALACSIIGAIEPILNPLLVFLLAGEAPGMISLIGAAIVILSVTFWSIWKARIPQPQ